MNKLKNENTIFYTIQIQMWQDCNLNCSHCWRDAENWWIKLKPDNIINNLSDFFIFFKEKYKNIKIMLNITWGEIFMYFDKIKPFLKLIDVFNFIEINLFTNWTLITDKHLNFLKKYKNNITIQISIDWFQETHDKIRWKGNFKKSIDNIIKIWKLWFTIRVQSVISTINIKEIAWLIVFFCELPIKFLSFRKILWVWRAKNMKWNSIKTDEYINEFYWTISEMYKYIIYKWKILSLWCDISAITFKYKNLKKLVWNCWVITNNVIWIEPDWKILLCSRLPIKIWNIYEDSLIDIYWKYLDNVSKYFSISSECKKCSEYNTCKWWDLCDIYQSYWNLKWHTSFLCWK